MIRGYPIDSAALKASSIDSTAMLFGVFTPISFSFLTNKSRSSVFIIASTEVPNTFTLYLSRIPLLYSSVPQFSAV